MATSEDRRLTISTGVSAGAHMANQDDASKSFIWRASATVGTSGYSDKRVVVVTASMRSLPLLTKGVLVNRVSNMMCTCPATRSDIAGPVPRYGMWVMKAPVRYLKYSATR